MATPGPLLAADVVPAPESTVLAVDVGGTTTKGARVDSFGRRVARVTRATGRGGDAVDRVLDVCHELRDSSTLAATLAVPGIIDEANGTVRYSVNLGWTDVPLGQLALDRLSVPTAVVHDVRAACRAEAAVGLGRGCADMVVLVIGTGIAAGIVAGGQPVIGATSSAGEIGHMIVRPGGELCPCGQRGCLEAYASAAAISRRYVEQGGRRADASAAEIAMSADPLARQVWHDAISALAKALAAVTVALDPALIVIAGGLSRAGDALADPIRAELAQALTWRPAPPIRLSAFTENAGLAGAALGAWELAGYPNLDRLWVTVPQQIGGQR